MADIRETDISTNAMKVYRYITGPARPVRATVSTSLMTPADASV
jgi:hypothetical protein